MKFGSEKQPTSPSDTVVKLLITANVDVKGTRGFKIHEPKGSTPNVINPLQNINQNASINSSTAKPMICNKIENFKFVRTVSQDPVSGPRLSQDRVYSKNKNLILTSQYSVYWRSHIFSGVDCNNYYVGQDCKKSKNQQNHTANSHIGRI